MQLEDVMQSLQEITIFLTNNFDQKNLPHGFFAPMSNLTKVPFWKSRFGPNRSDYVFLVGFFTSFFTGVFY
jgi:hypothetical protein